MNAQQKISPSTSSGRLDTFNSEFRVRSSCIAALSRSLTRSFQVDVDSVFVSPLDLFPTGLDREIPSVDGPTYVDWGREVDTFSDEAQERLRSIMAISHPLI